MVYRPDACPERRKASEAPPKPDRFAADLSRLATGVGIVRRLCHGRECLLQEDQVGLDLFRPVQVLLHLLLPVELPQAYPEFTVNFVVAGRQFNCAAKQRLGVGWFLLVQGKATALQSTSLSFGIRSCSCFKRGRARSISSIRSYVDANPSKGTISSGCCSHRVAYWAPASRYLRDLNRRSARHNLPLKYLGESFTNALSNPIALSRLPWVSML